MRASNLYFPTLKESPSDAEIISHKLMLRAGLIRKLASGLYTWLPLGLRVLQKITQIVREEMNNAGCQELLMPAVQPAELWQETKRWEEFGPQLLKMQDRHKRDFCFGPTHEEVITDLVRNELTSYKELPKTFYQIQTKFRDEIRPRFGVMRAREFLMKDAYSFHLNEECLADTYKILYQAYSNIFTRLGLTFRAVLADTGAIGGSMSHEFHVLADSGEDQIAFCPESDYAANVELASSSLDNSNEDEILQELKIVYTPGIKSVPEQAKYIGIDTKKIIKTLLVEGATKEHPVVALLIRGDHDLNPIKAEKSELIAKPFKLITEENLQKVANCNPGFVGPINLKNIPLIADHNVISMKNFSCGANENDKHYIGVNWDRDLKTPDKVMDLKLVKKGDPSPDGKGILDIARGIEVGHIFMLGDKYSKAMNATVLDQNGKQQHMVMGCYGIGVSRIVAAAIEQNNDDKGIIWPEALAPFKVVIIPIDFHKEEEVKKHALKLYEDLTAKGEEVLLDDRNERPGVKFKDMDLIGIPHRVVISKKTLADKKVEYKNRVDSESSFVDLESVIQKIIK